MTPAWAAAAGAVRQLLEYIDDNNIEARTKFKRASVKVKPDPYNSGGLIVVAYDAKDRPFKYAWYIRADGSIEADGY